MKSSRKMVAGLSDAAFAAFGTFLAGIVAVRELPTETLALYAVLFSATVLSMLLARQLHYIPAQIAANLEPGLQSPQIRADAGRAALVSLGAFVIVVASGLSLAGHVSLITCLVMGATAGAYTVISPLQDHVRSGLHLVDRHFSAAACSITLATVISIGTVWALTRPFNAFTIVVPFGSLFIGNVLSLIVGLTLLRGADQHVAYVPPTLTVRARFLFSEVAVQGAWFGCNYGVLLILGATALAHLEAARILSSPISILVTALVTFMGPAMLRKLKPTPEHPHGARRDMLQIFAMLTVGGGLYIAALAIFGHQIATLLNKPFDLGLWSARIIEQVIEGSAAIVAFLVFATGKTRAALANSVAAGVLGLGGTLALATFLGPFALPVGQAIGMAVRLTSSVVVVERATRSGAEAPDPAFA